MYETLHLTLAPFYLYIKLIHITVAFLWAFSVALAYVYILVPVMQAWRRNQDDAGHTIMRNWAFERFDQGVVVEHIALPLIVISGVMLIIAGGWGPESGWLVLKLCIFVAAVIPMEAYDYHITHLGGNKRHLREKNDAPDWHAYETALHKHWWFFLMTTPLVGVVVLGILFLAVTKPF